MKQEMSTNAVVLTAQRKWLMGQLALRFSLDLSRMFELLRQTNWNVVEVEKQLLHAEQQLMLQATTTIKPTASTGPYGDHQRSTKKPPTARKSSPSFGSELAKSEIDGLDSKKTNDSFEESMQSSVRRRSGAAVSATTGAASSSELVTCRLRPPRGSLSSVGSSSTSSSSTHDEDGQSSGSIRHSWSPPTNDSEVEPTTTTAAPSSSTSNNAATKKRQFVCRVCAKRFPFQSNLNQHLVVHSDERPFQCDLCDKAFKVIAHLVRHQYTCHAKCPKCSVQCVDKAELAQHVCRQGNIDATKTQLHECPVCLKSFNWKQALRNHLKSHNL